MKSKDIVIAQVLIIYMTIYAFLSHAYIHYLYILGLINTFWGAFFLFSRFTLVLMERCPKAITNSYMKT